MRLHTSKLVKRYRNRTVVKRVSIEVEQGEIVGLLGPNGAGKTTTFYMIVGLISPNEGKIFVDDMEITKEPVYKRARLGIGYLSQEASVFRKLSVEDNLYAVLEMSNLSREEQMERAEELLREFGLEKISFGDELFLSSKPKFRELGPMLKNLGLPWGAQARVSLVDKEFLEMIKGSGCIGVGYGIESGSQKILNSMNKKITVEQIEFAMTYTQKLKIPIKVHYFFL